MNDFSKELKEFNANQKKYSLHIEINYKNNYVACRFNNGDIYMQCIATKTSVKSTSKKDLLVAMYEVAKRELGI